MKLFLSAGDLSGDNAAARLVAALKQHTTELRLFGLGRGKLRKAGQEQFAEGRDLAVLGFWEVARRYWFFRRLMLTCVREIEKRRPDAVVLIDYPGFNLRLAARIRKLNIPVIYYISPQIWAWGRERVSQIEQNVDLMLVILPFETDFYAGTRVNAHFVGHYLLEDIPQKYIASVPPDRESGYLALLPGSRPQEIERMLPTMLETARRFNRANGAKAVIAGVEDTYDYDASLKAAGVSDIEVIYDDSRRVIHDARLVLTASGTATLETGIIGRPMVVVYKTGEITYQIARRLVTLDKIALVNLVAGKEVAPEFVQHAATPAGIVEALNRLWTGDELYRRTVDDLHRIPRLLGGIGASDRAARMLVDFLEKD